MNAPKTFKLGEAERKYFSTNNLSRTIFWMGGQNTLPVDVADAIEQGGPSEVYTVEIHGEGVRRAADSNPFIGSRTERDPAHGRVLYFGGYTRVPVNVAEEIVARQATVKSAEE